MLASRQSGSVTRGPRFMSRWVVGSHDNRLIAGIMGTTYPLPGHGPASQGSSNRMAPSYRTGLIATTRHLSKRPRRTHRDGPSSCNSARAPGFIRCDDSTKAPPGLKLTMATSWPGLRTAARDQAIRSGVTRAARRRSSETATPRSTVVLQSQTKARASARSRP